MTDNPTTEAKSKVKAILEAKFLKLINEGMEPKAAFADVMGAFEQQFPGLIEKMNTKTESSNIGKQFAVKTTAGIVIMHCIKWTRESRAFMSDEGFLELDWMEYADQQMLGRITKLG
jgi:hypothetical protein